MPTLGLFGINRDLCTRPEVATRIARLAEALGYDSLWAPEHVVVPSPRVDPSPMDPDEPILDPLVALAHVAAVTERIRLGTGVLLLPQRNPVVTAKQLASLDVLSGGRLILGIGVGYLEPEMRAIGVPMERRGARADEYLAAMSSLWEDEAPAFEGEFASFTGVDAYPRPVQRPIPVVVGGHSAAAHRRAARHGAWYGFRLGLRATAEQLEGLRAAGADVHVSVSPARRLDREAVKAYAELGVDRLVLLTPNDLSEDELAAFVEAHAPEGIGAQAV